MNTENYLERIGVSGVELAASAETLNHLQRSHLLSVPFENLDIHWKRPIILDTDRFYKKIVGDRRGGFCYELNGVFNEMLTSIGFTTRLVSARVSNGTEHGPEYDHAAIIVNIGGEEFLADVGFGEFTARPLKFDLDTEQTDDVGTFVIRRFDGEYFEVAKYVGGEWKSEYIFKDIARELSEFTEMCEFQQHSPDSHFRKGKLCSIMTENGRKTLTDKKFVVTADGVKQEEPVTSDSMFYRILRDGFAIDQYELE